MNSKLEEAYKEALLKIDIEPLESFRTELALDFLLDRFDGANDDERPLLAALILLIGAPSGSRRVLDSIASGKTSKEKILTLVREKLGLKIISPLLSLEPAFGTSGMIVLDELLEEAGFYRMIEEFLEDSDVNLKLYSIRQSMLCPTEKAQAIFAREFKKLSLEQQSAILSTLRYVRKNHIIARTITQTIIHLDNPALEHIEKVLEYLPPSEDITPYFRDALASGNLTGLQSLNIVQALFLLGDSGSLQLLENILLSSELQTMKAAFRVFEEIASRVSGDSANTSARSAVLSCLHEFLISSSSLVRTFASKTLLMFKQEGLKIFFQALKQNRKEIVELASSFLDELTEISRRVIFDYFREASLETARIFLEPARNSKPETLLNILFGLAHSENPEISSLALSSLATSSLEPKIIAGFLQSWSRQPDISRTALLNFARAKEGVETSRFLEKELEEVLKNPDSSKRLEAYEILLSRNTYKHFDSVLLDALKDPAEEIQLLALKVIKSSGKLPGELMELLRRLTYSKNPDISTLSRSLLSSRPDFKSSRGTGTPAFSGDSGHLKDTAADIFSRSEFELKFERLAASENSTERMKAIEMITNFRSEHFKKFNSILSRFLVDPDKKLRASYARILGRCQCIESIDILLALLSDPDVRVVANAIESLGLIQDTGVKTPEIERHIIPFLNDRHHRVRSNAIVTLYRTGYKKAVNLLSEMLASGDELTKSAAIFSIGELGDPKLIPILINYIGDMNDMTQRNALKALNKFSPADLENYSDELQRIVRQCLSSNDQATLLQAKELLKRLKEVNL